ncbi:MAG: enoyl-CoA hydratase/isomerase family protein [Chloroflexi bacterium]|nr:enoyl-CoA hydratase/isomerase family protein [Chloroflexota bacterium]
MEVKDLLYTVEEGIATITLNRPQTLNAITPKMYEDMAQYVEEAKKDSNVNVLIVTGAGRAFCAGANPRALDKERRGQQTTAASSKDIATPPILGEANGHLWVTHAVPKALADFDKPCIAAINGPAAGGGMDLASMCDIRIASDKAKFTMAYIRMGVIPAAGGCFFLPRIVGLANAYELVWTGKTIDAQEALRIGYLNRVVPHDNLMEATRELALRLARGPTVAIRLSKRLIRQCLELDLHGALQATEVAQRIARSTEDSREGPKAWLEKREPIFKGR